MQLILYNLIKPLKTYEWVVLMAGYALYVLCLCYFSSFFDSRFDQLINQNANQVYYQNQSEYVIWLVLGVMIVIKSHHIIEQNELNIWVILKSKYLYAKYIVYYLEVFLVFFVVYGTYQVINFVVFHDYIGLGSDAMKLAYNGIVLTSFMVLWIRIQNKYTLILGFLMVVLLPTMDLSDYKLIHFILPYNRIISMIKWSEVGLLCVLYNIFSLELQKLKIK